MGGTGMKSIVLLLLGFANRGHCLHNTSSHYQFDQHDYDIILGHVELTKQNPAYLKFATVSMGYFNRSHKVINSTFEARKNFMVSRLDLQVYKFMSNEYRFFPISMSVNACEEFRNNAFDIGELMKTYSNIDACDIRKDVRYHFVNGHPDGTKFPPHVPAGSYKVAMKTFCGNNIHLSDVDYYAEIKEKPKNVRG